MKIVYLLILCFYGMNLFAEDVEVSVDPKEAVVNETFFVTFKIKAPGGEEPYISFNPVGASVLGKRSQGLSISTVVINGRFTTTKEQEVVYELMAEKPGQAYLKDIKIEMNGKAIPAKDVKINILNEARRIPEAFIETEASKTKVYLGEGLDVNYYLYYRASTNATDVKEFPKLNKFIKRFHHMKSPPETVQYKGQVFRRLLVYSARLYPEKTGTAVLDPMKISVQIVEEVYGGFGFGTQRYKNKDLASQRIEIEVLPLPTEGVPKSFTGLVGEHEFSLQAPKQKYLVNEPIELRLEVKGKGAVENFDAPVIYSDNNLEQFDTKSEVTEIGMQAAKKVFDYTLLARGPLKIPARELALSYFDPSSGKYIEKKIQVPALEVGGAAMATASGGTREKDETVLKNKETESKNDLINSFFQQKPVEKNALGLVGPSLKGQARWFDQSVTVLNVFLGLCLAGIIGQWAMGQGLRKKTLTEDDSIKRDITHMKKKGLRYSELYRVLSALDKTNKMAQGTASIADVIDENSKLSVESKQYFKDALAFAEGGDFAKNSAGKTRPVNFEKKHFNELMKHL